MHDWNAYYEAVGERPNSIVIGVLSEYDMRTGAALDLGAGNFRDSVALQRAGFRRVVAIDSSNTTPPTPPGIEFHRMPVEQYVPESDTFDLIISCNTLFFVPKQEVLRLVGNSHRGLRQHGVFACNVLAERDDWVTGGRDVSCFTASDIEDLRRQYNVTAAGEAEWDGATASGKPKHWHTWSFVFQKV